MRRCWRGATTSGEPPSEGRRAAEARASAGDSGFAEPLGGDESEGDEDGEDQQLLHDADPTHTATTAGYRGGDLVGSVPGSLQSRRSDGEEVPGAGVRRRVPEFRHGPGFDLTDPLPGQVEMLTDLFQGAGLAPVKAEAQSEDLAFTFVQR